jgi:hypothetical protein
MPTARLALLSLLFCLHGEKEIPAVVYFLAS